MEDLNLKRDGSRYIGSRDEVIAAFGEKGIKRHDAQKLLDEAESMGQVVVSIEVGAAKNEVRNKISYTIFQTTGFSKGKEFGVTRNTG